MTLLIYTQQFENLVKIIKHVGQDEMKLPDLNLLPNRLIAYMFAVIVQVELVASEH